MRGEKEARGEYHCGLKFWSAMDRGGLRWGGIGFRVVLLRDIGDVEWRGMLYQISGLEGRYPIVKLDSTIYNVLVMSKSL